MKKILISLAILFFVIASFNSVSAQKNVALVSNSIDYNINSNIISILQSRGMNVVYFGRTDPGYNTYPYVIILGGPDAPDHTGALSLQILPPNESYNLRNIKGYQIFYEKRDQWISRQEVFVIAGSDRENTYFAVQSNLVTLIDRIAEDTGSPAVPYTLINSSQLKQLIASGEPLFIIDVRNSDEYRAGHISGAVNITGIELGSVLSSIPRDRKIIVYCSTSQAAITNAQFLANKGFANVYALTDPYSVYINS
ncbi:MAG: rhodanese-like domain-containing protein [Candidatus Methanofastidiosum sp.]|nr:rhodanese-like domain-containing protein [Methanofastidiosum sp.]NYT13268.1 rhodanese-like domain-containing protein [Candidatus Methanofastidiosa archaeon]